MAFTAHVPVELYLHTEYEPAVEYVDGEIEGRNAGEGKHSAWQAALTTWFLNHAMEWGVRVRPEYRVQTEQSHFRLPDVAVIDPAFADESIGMHPPIAVFEVLSPDDTYKRLMVKLREYAAMGVEAIFVVDPDTGVFERFEGGQLVRRESFTLPERGIEFPFTQIASLVS